MQSHEAIKAAVDDKGPKVVAAALDVSLSLVYKWCEGKTGNPLDRVDELVTATGSTQLLSWLCTRAGGSFLPRPPAVPADDARLVDDTRLMLKEFSDMLAAMTGAFLDGKVSDAEAALVRREWEELLPIAEGLVRACEARATADRQLR